MPSCTGIIAQIPEFEGHPLIPAASVQERMLDRLSADIEWINQRVGDQAYRCNILEGNGSDQLMLSEKHIQLLIQFVRAGGHKQSSFSRLFNLLGLFKNA